MKRTPPKGNGKSRTRDPALHRQRILDAAVSLFARQGFSRTTTREIAAEAGVSEGTIYVHFPGKQQLLQEFLVKYALEPAVEIFSRSGPGKEEAVFRALIKNRLGMWDKIKDLSRIAFGEAMFNPEVARFLRDSLFEVAVGKLANFIKGGIRSGTFRKLDTEVVSRLLFSTVFGTFVLWGFIAGDFPGKITPAMLEKILPDLILNGLLEKKPGSPAPRTVARQRVRRPSKEAS